MPKRPQLSDRLRPAADPQGAAAYFGPSPAEEPQSRQRATVAGKRDRSPVSHPPGTAAGIPETVSSHNPPALAELLAQPAQKRGPKWDEANQRASYYLPVELLRQLDGVATAGLSKSQIVTAALQHYLGGGAIVRDQ